MWKKTKKHQWELAERATQEEKEIIVAEVEYCGKINSEFKQFTEDEIKRFEESKKCCNPTEECQSPSEWCCKKCPIETCAKAAELRAKYRELDDDFDNVLEPKKCFSIAGCPICWTQIVLLVFILLLLAKRAL